ncbi:MAG TPA: hypothetical protein PLB89_13140 [Flavobacteriales bacterium]|nr:hypothetical protein [Flavobacteriales bacterium]
MSYDPPAGLTTARSYACFLKLGPFLGITTYTWCIGVRQVSVFSAGVLPTGGVTLGVPADPAPITFLEPPSGSANLSYQWYYKDGLSIPQSDVNETEWTKITNAGTSKSYDPPGPLNYSRTYACKVSPAGLNTCGAQHWAKPTFGVKVSGMTNVGEIEHDDVTICHGGDPARIAQLSVPTSNVSFTYQWYSYNGRMPIVGGSMTENGVRVEWVPIPGATAATYDPPAGLTSTRSYGCKLVPTAGSHEWMDGSKVVNVLAPFSLGTLTGTQSIPPAGTPSRVSLSTTGSPGSFTYTWYYKEGLVAAPTGSSTAGWTRAESRGVEFIDPPALAISRTYACFMTPSGTLTCGAAGWATGAAQITVTDPVNRGQLASLNQVDNQVVCNSSADGSPITFSTAPSGAPSFSYQWYSQSAIVPAPTGSSIAGWTAEPGATAATFDPPAGRTTSRTYACFVIPSAGTAGWAAGRRVVQVLAPLAPAVVTSGDQTLVGPADPATITLSSQAVGSSFFFYQWYFKDGIAAAPTGSSTAGWTAINGATQTSFDPPAGLSASRTFACFHTPSGTPLCGSGGWATGVRKVTVTR